MRRFVPLAIIVVGLVAPSTALAQRGVVDAARRAAMEAEQGEGRGQPDDRREERIDERSRPQNVPPPRQQAPPPPQRRISEGAAIAAVQRIAGPGHHLDVFAGVMGGRPIYTVRWAADSGQRRDYHVDAVTGAVL